MRKTRAFLAVVLSASVGLGGVAYATDDTIVADGDLSDAIQVNSHGKPQDEALAFGGVCRGNTYPATEGANVNLALVRGKSTDEHFADGTVDFSMQGVANASSTHGVVAASAPPDLVLSGWGSKTEDQLSSPTTSRVTVQVPSGAADGSYSATVSYRAEGAKVGGGTLAKNKSLQVTWTVKAASDPSCVTNTAPVLTVPSDYSVDATGPDGAAVTYAGLSASDGEDGDLTEEITCEPPTGSTLPLGPNEITCSVVDSLGASDTDSFTVTVLNNAPTVTVGGVTATSYDKGSVPSATCNVVDVEDGNSSFAATLSSITGPYASDGIGAQTASCSYTDDDGATDSDSVTYSIIDPTAPVITYTLSPTFPDGQNGWFVSVVTLDWTVTDDESPNSLDLDGCGDLYLTEDHALTTYSCSATSAGGSSGPVDVSIKRDGTAPTASASATPAPNANGWNNTDVTVSFSTANAGVSGLDSCSADVVVSANTSVAGQSVGGTCTDLAGNVSDEASTTVKLDKTAPTVARVGGPSAQTYYIGLDILPSAPSCNIGDALSGPDNGSCVVNGFATTVGTHTVSVTGSDLAGNSTTSSSVTYTIANLTTGGFYQPVDMDKVNIVKGGSTVPLKFEVFAGSTEVTLTSVVDTFRAYKTNCDGTSLGVDEIEQYTSGATVLRYDSTGGQFIQNWQTPKGAGICYHVVLTLDGGVSIEANFKTK